MKYFSQNTSGKAGGLSIRASAYKSQAEKMTLSLKSSFKAALNRFFLMLILEGSFFSRLIAS